MQNLLRIILWLYRYCNDAPGCRLVALTTRRAINRDVMKSAVSISFYKYGSEIWCCQSTCTLIRKPLIASNVDQSVIQGHFESNLSLCLDTSERSMNNAVLISGSANGSKGCCEGRSPFLPF